MPPCSWTMDGNTAHNTHSLKAKHRRTLKWTKLSQKHWVAGFQLLAAAGVQHPNLPSHNVCASHSPWRGDFWGGDTLVHESWSLSSSSSSPTSPSSHHQSLPLKRRFLGWGQIADVWNQTPHSAAKNVKKQKLLFSCGKVNHVIDQQSMFTIWFLKRRKTLCVKRSKTFSDPDDSAPANWRYLYFSSVHLALETLWAVKY